MISQIPSCTENMDQLVYGCSAKRCAALQFRQRRAPTAVSARPGRTPDHSALPWLAQKAYDTRESSERETLRELLRTLNFECVLIQADALHTTHSSFTGASPRGPSCSE